MENAAATAKRPDYPGGDVADMLGWKGENKKLDEILF
jgi:hypothetical protein